MNVCVRLQAAQQRVNELNSRYKILPKKQDTFFLAVLPKERYHTLWEMYNRIQSSHEQSSTVPRIPSKVVLCLVAQSCPSLCDPLDYSPPVSSVHGIFQARILEWVAFSFSRGSFPTQGFNPGLLHWQEDSLPLCYLGSPR